MIVCPSVEAIWLAFMGQCSQGEATVDFPAELNGQVFCIRRAKARSNMIGLNLSMKYNKSFLSPCQSHFKNRGYIFSTIFLK